LSILVATAGQQPAFPSPLPAQFNISRAQKSIGPDPPSKRFTRKCG
jgi:hypothetical protein